MPTEETVLAAADANMETTWAALLGTMPGASVERRSDVTMMASGLPIPLFNPAFAYGPVHDPAEAIATAVSHYGARDLPFVIYFRDEVNPALAAPAEAAGLVEHYRPPLMVMEPVATAPPPPAGLEIRTVDAATMGDCARMLAEGFAMPPDLVAAVLSPALLALPGFTAFVGYVDGQPVSTAAAYVDGDTTGVYNVATAPAARGKGYGAAVTWAATRAGVATGTVRAILQASEEGRPVYERMGYATPTRLRQFQGPPTA